MGRPTHARITTYAHACTHTRAHTHRSLVVSVETYQRQQWSISHCARERTTGHSTNTEPSAHGSHRTMPEPPVPAVYQLHSEKRRVTVSLNDPQSWEPWFRVGSRSTHKRSAGPLNHCNHPHSLLPSGGRVKPWATERVEQITHLHSRIAEHSVPAGPALTDKNKARPD